MSELTKPPHQQPTVRATIHIGASSVSLLISNLHSDGSDTEIDFLEQSIPIAHDIFSNGKLTRTTVEGCSNIIKGYLAAINELGFHHSNIQLRVVGTNILSEASNKDTFLNRIMITSGIHIDILDDGEMTRLIYLKTRRRLSDTPTMQKRTTLVLHVGPGNTRALLFEKGRIASYSSYRLGTHRTAEAVHDAITHNTDYHKLTRSHISGQLESIVEDYSRAKIEDIVLIGYEIQIMSQYIHTNKHGNSDIQDLAHLCQQARTMNDDQLVKNFQIDYHTAEALLPALEINLAIAESLNLQRIRIPNSDYERGLLHDLFISTTVSEEFSNEVIRSATSIGQKYRVHQLHAENVSRLSLSLFHQLSGIHKMSSHDALLLHTAAILHECGGFISPKAHHKHSQYIILNCEIFGLTQSDIALVALIARYHRNSEPNPTHAIYRDLPVEDRIRVSKLASLLRIADALDRSHSGRIQNIETRIGRRRLHIHLKNITDANTERLAMCTKGTLFENIFGYEINLVEDKPAN